MLSGVTSSARSPSQTKMMTRRAVDPASCCCAPRPPPGPSTRNDKALKKRSVLIFMVVLVDGGNMRRARVMPVCRDIEGKFAKKVPKKRLSFGEGCEPPHNSARWHQATLRPSHDRWHWTPSRAEQGKPDANVLNY